jgi:hypothetical protein
VAPDPRPNEEGCLMKRRGLMKNKQGTHFFIFFHRDSLRGCSLQRTVSFFWGQSVYTVDFQNRRVFPVLSGLLTETQIRRKFYCFTTVSVSPALIISCGRESVGRKTVLCWWMSVLFGSVGLSPVDVSLATIHCHTC